MPRPNEPIVWIFYLLFAKIQSDFRRSHRLAVRTPGSHPGNRGSIPLGITNSQMKVPKWDFLISLIYEKVQVSSHDS